MARALAAVLVATAALLAGAPAARGDGAWFPSINFVKTTEGRAGSLVASPRQEAILDLGGAKPTEKWVTVTLRTQFRAGPEELAWLVPVPGEPENIRAGDDRSFELFEATTAPRFIRTQLTFEPHLGCGCGGQEAAPSTAPAVVVERSGTAGIFQWTVLAATDAGELAKWLAENHYAMPVGAERVFDRYVKENWHWLAMKVRAEETKNPVLAPHPIVYDYHATKLVYPLVISQLSADLENEVVLYVAADRFYEAENWSNRLYYDLGDLKAKSGVASRTNYEELLRRATEGAGGHLFVTEYARVGLLWNPDLTRLEQRDSLIWVEHQTNVFTTRHVTRLRAVMTAKDMDRDVVLVPCTREPEAEKMRPIEVGGGGARRGYGATVGTAEAGLALGGVVFGLFSLGQRGRWRRGAGLGALIAGAAVLAMV